VSQVLAVPLWILDATGNSQEKVVGDAQDGWSL